MNFSLIATWIYFSVYAFVFFITSIICAIKTTQELQRDTETQSQSQQEQSPQENETTTNDDTSIEMQDKTENITSTKGKQKKKGCKWFMKSWIKLIWQKKKIYLALIPHLFDQATDIGVIVKYYTDRNNPDISENINVYYWFYISIGVLILHRMVSSFAMWTITKNYIDVLLQSLDILMIKSVYTSYVLGTTEPSTTQRYLGLMEATFEATPQLLLSISYIIKTETFEPIIVVSLITSLWSLTSRVASDDKSIFHENWQSLDASYKKCPCINFRFVFRVLTRFLEISSRLTLFTLLWINIGGLGTAIIIGAEMFCLIIICILSKSVGAMGNLMYFVYDQDYHTSPSDIPWVLLIVFAVYRLLFSYVYLILLTIFSNVKFESAKVEDYSVRHRNTMIQPFSQFLFYWCWITHFLWPCFFAVAVFKGTENTAESGDLLSTSRNIEYLLEQKRFMDILELLQFGVNDIDKQKDALNEIISKTDDNHIKSKANKMLEKIDLEKD